MHVFILNLVELTPILVTLTMTLRGNMFAL